jgi:hypothetical protein
MSNPFREIYLEALKGGQHKIDVDKDGKIEGEDLAKLRAKKMKEELVSEKAKEKEEDDEMEDEEEEKEMKEEVEQIDEVEKATGGLKDACWKGYTAVGMKMKNGKKVPNCVPTKESTNIPFDGPYTKSKPVKNSDGTLQSPMSRARELAKQALAKKKIKEENINELTDDEIKKLRGDAADNVEKSIDKQSDDRIAKLKADKEDSKKSFLQKVGDKQIAMVKGAVKGLMKKEEAEQVEEGYYEKPASAYRRKGDEVGGGSSKNSAPFDGPYTKSKPVKNSDGTIQSPMSRARELAKQALAKNKMKEEVEINEANHREFASKGLMHPDMAKNMNVGQEHDYYEHGTGDKVSGKVLKKTATEVHMKQTHDSYDPKKTGTVHKFKIASSLPEEISMEFTQEELQLIEQFIEIAEKMNMSKASMGDVIRDFKKSDAPQFAGKSVEKRRQMAIAAKLSADRETKKEETELVSFKGFSLDEIKMSDLPSRKVTGKYGTEYYKGEKEKDEKGYDADDDKESSTEKRGRGRPKGSASGARQKGSTPKKKGSGVEMTGYPLHLPNSR